MRFEGESKLGVMRDYYENAVSAAQGAFEEFTTHRAQYRGDNAIDGSSERAAFCRNVTYEVIESIVSTVIPAARVEAGEVTEENGRLAESVERLCSSLRHRLDFERVNDITERDATITGAAVYLLEWDDSVRKRGSKGEVCISAIDPTDFFPQPNRALVEDMDYCFIRSRTTRLDLMERYGVQIADSLGEVADGDGDGETVEVVTCFYFNGDGLLSKFVFSGECVLEDVENYYSRKTLVCKRCGKSRENCDCGGFEGIYVDRDFEEIDGSLVGSSEPTVRVPWYYPRRMPVVVRTNITRIDRWYGESDCEFLRPYQQELNKLESRIHAKVMGSSVIPVLPAESEFRLDNSINTRVLRLREGEEKGQYGVISTAVDISQDMENAERVYQMAKRSMGITDSFQGHADDTALSGRAKQIQVDQSAGRMASKRVMKQLAFAEMDRIIFEYYLAYADEPRKLSFVDSMGKRKSDEFNRYDFIRRDEKSGEYYYYDDFLFAVDSTNERETERELLAEKLLTAFPSGILGEPSSAAAVLRLWQCMDKLHHPLGRFNSEYFSALGSDASIRGSAVNNDGDGVSIE